MNIFCLSHDPTEAAQMLCDKHVPKMCVETAQILCTVAKDHGIVAPYKATHHHHPCVLWVGASQANWLWTLAHGVALTIEHTYRFGTVHSAFDVLVWLHENVTPVITKTIVETRLTPFAQAMPEEHRREDVVEAYRSYYSCEKRRFAKWQRGRLPPTWWER